MELLGSNKALTFSLSGCKSPNSSCFYLKHRIKPQIFQIKFTKVLGGRSITLSMVFKTGSSKDKIVVLINTAMAGLYNFSCLIYDSHFQPFNWFL